MKILLTGASGQIGGALRAALAPLGEVHAPGSDALDLASADSICAAVRALQPALIVNPGGYTAVDLAETDREAAMAVNATAPGVLAEEANKLGAALIHFSTDYVFDGTKDGAYVEDDPTGPLNVYGESKLAGERALAAAGGPHLVLRTSWIYSRGRRNFLRTMLALADRPELRIVDDQFGAPTWAQSVAEAVAAIAARAERPSGVYHMSCAGKTSWCGFAQAIFRRRRGKRSPRLVPITTAEYVTPARRPANSVLDNAKLARDFGLALPAWEAALDACLAEVGTDPISGE